MSEAPTRSNDEDPARPEAPRTRLEASRPATRLDAPEPRTRLEAPSPTTRLDTPEPRTRLDPPGPGTPPGTRLDGGAPATGAAATYVSHNLPPGLQAKYSIIRELGRGSEAFVFLCRSDFGDEVAIKLYHHPPRFSFDPRAAQYVNRFTREHAVQLFDRGEDHGVSYEVLEYCAGGTLADMLRRSPRPGDAEFAHEVLAELSGALATLQSEEGGQRLVHADVKPSNVLVRTVTPLDLVFTDFGLTVDLADRTHMTNTGAGTVAYAAPGSAFSHRLADDWWSVGMILFEIIVGRIYFEAADGRHLGERAIEEHLAVRDIDVSEVADSGIAGAERWMLLISGLLTRDHLHRWGADEVRRWRKGESPEVHRGADPAQPDSGGTIGRASHPLAIWGDTRVQTPHELGVAFSKDPKAAARAVTGTEINRVLKWLWNDAGLDDPLSGIQDDWKAAERVAYLVARLAPEQPIEYLGHDISTTPLLQRAVFEAAGTDQRSPGQKDVRTGLYESRLLGTLVHPLYRPTYDTLDANWHDVTRLAFDEADARDIRLEDNDKTTIRDNALHALASEDARTTIVDEISSRIEDSPHAREVSWFDSLVIDFGRARS